MWVQRSREEREQEHLAAEAGRESILKPLLAATVLTVLSVVLYVIGFRALGGGAIIVTRGGASNPLALLVVAVVLFAVSFVLFRSRQKATGLSAFATEKGTICSRCHAPSLEVAGADCNCGGVFEPLEHWEWIDEPSHDRHDIAERRNDA